MIEQFSFDVFLSHSATDKAVVRAVAEQLRADGLKVWLDEWEIKAGDSDWVKIEEGLAHSRVLVLCMSANAFGSEEAGTFRFRDPQNKERRFIPLRLDDTPIKVSLAQFLCISWLPADREQEYAKLFEACRRRLRRLSRKRRPRTSRLHRGPFNSTTNWARTGGVATTWQSSPSSQMSVVVILVHAISK